MMPSNKLPSPFRHRVADTFLDGTAWLEALPSLLAECERRWRLRVGRPFELSYNYVAPALTDQGQEVVVKLGVPNPDFRNEIGALRLYRGGASVQLLDADEDQGLLLLERLRPGSMLSCVEDDEEATLIAARVMRELWRPLPEEPQFPTASQWASGLKDLRQRFRGGTGPFDPQLVQTAESLFSELLMSHESYVLVHGDLHHFNILSAKRRPWVAIDPKGLAANRDYEVGALLRNPTPSRYVDLTVQRMRVDLLADELRLDKQRIVGWGLAQSVLAAWWRYEDSSPEWEASMACAQTLMRLLA